MLNQETICAIATPSGSGAIALIRISGNNAIQIADKIFSFKNKSKRLETQSANTIHFGVIMQQKKILDEVLVSIFKAPNSYTGENSIEISCHGSQFIQQQILQLIIENGARLASPGEFTLRAFLNGKLDLSQAEGVADLIASSSEISHKIALNQMRGGFSNDLKKLRTELLDFSSLIELELDFSEEEVEFADRKKLFDLLSKIELEVYSLVESFKYGNVIKKGIPVAIIGEPNVGKSTLLNALLNEEKAIVSDIPGTTRDSIEDVMHINGIPFRFIDTAGIRNSEDEIENLGISRTYEKINQASVILYMIDISEITAEQVKERISDFTKHMTEKTKRVIVIANKIDKLQETPKGFKNFVDLETIFVSAKRKENIKLITDSLLKSVENNYSAEDSIVSNARHYDALVHVKNAIENIKTGIGNNISGDFLAQDIRHALHYLGEITGEITTDEILGNIFSKFCIGK
jgi:tRNA modification GTPase